MTEPRIVDLRRAGVISPGAVGPKAMGLVRLFRMALPVPPAFCIAAQAYLDHLHDHRLVQEIERTLPALEAAPAPEAEDLLARIQDRIAAAPLSEGLSREVERHLAALPDAPLAVRSSATAEDLPGRSFAGLHDTFLGVTGLPSCLEAIGKCWASLWTPRAFHYRRLHGFDHLRTAMAVIVQTLIPADASGVVFTAHPSWRSGKSSSASTPWTSTSCRS